MLDYARHGLHPPRPGQVWIVNPPDFLLFDTATGQILENVPDTEGEQPSIPQSQYNVGIAWSATGAWAVRTGATVADAQAQALAACSAESQSCTIARLALSADTQACYALVRSGPVLFGAVETDIDTATNTAMASCEDSDHPNCTLQIANCNDHP